MILWFYDMQYLFVPYVPHLPIGQNIWLPIQVKFNQLTVNEMVFSQVMLCNATKSQNFRFKVCWTIRNLTKQFTKIILFFSLPLAAVRDKNPRSWHFTVDRQWTVPSGSTNTTFRAVGRHERWWFINTIVRSFASAGPKRFESKIQFKSIPAQFRVSIGMYTDRHGTAVKQSKYFECIFSHRSHTKWPIEINRFTVRARW